MFGRRPARHRRVQFDHGIVLDDVLDDCHPQAGSHWDALGHAGILPDLFHGGATRSDVDAGRSGTIRHWAQRGIAGRGLVLDLEPVWGVAGAGFDPTTSRAITVEDLERCRANTGLDYATGDILLLHTGFLRWYLGQPARTRHALAESPFPRWIGLAHTEDMARYLWNTGCAAVATDTPALEVWPPDKTRAAWPWGYLHRVLLAGLGIAIGELWWLADLAPHCRSIDRHQAFVTSAPWHHGTTVGSPANALAIT
nr:cyclase family protein [Amycolatopsis rubida]